MMQPLMMFLLRFFGGKIQLPIRRWFAHLSRVCVTLMYPMDAASSPSKWTWGLRIVTLALFDLLNAETVDPIIELI